AANVEGCKKNYHFNCLDLLLTDMLFGEWQCVVLVWQSGVDFRCKSNGWQILSVLTAGFGVLLITIDGRPEK
ncbi:hypothetical protein MKX03_015569, partial [Papaver bracteatum]